MCTSAAFLWAHAALCFPINCADTDSHIVTVFLQKEAKMEWWKSIVEGEPDIDTSKVRCACHCVFGVVGMGVGMGVGVGVDESVRRRCGRGRWCGRGHGRRRGCLYECLRCGCGCV